jgi:CobQ-like glutamine amidotransferase family enzyme
MTDSTLRIVSIYPVLLGTYGDGGNLRILGFRARARGLPVETIELDAGEPVPTQADLYLLGGGEDDAQVAAAKALRADGGLVAAVAAGAAVFAVCAGYQILGTHFPGSSGEPVAGLDLLDVTTDRLAQRAVGELLADPTVPGLTQPLTGYENHAGATAIGSAARPLGTVRLGVGNGVRAGEQAVGEVHEGAVQGNVVGTYLHGPGLARNPELADLLLSLVTGGPLAPFELPDVEALRAERLHAAGRS